MNNLSTEQILIDAITHEKQQQAEQQHLAKLAQADATPVSPAAILKGLVQALHRSVEAYEAPTVSALSKKSVSGSLSHKLS